MVPIVVQMLASCQGTQSSVTVYSSGSNWTGSGPIASVVTLTVVSCVLCVNNFQLVAFNQHTTYCMASYLCWKWQDSGVCMDTCTQQHARMQIHMHICTDTVHTQACTHAHTCTRAHTKHLLFLCFIMLTSVAQAVTLLGSTMVKVVYWLSSTMVNG